MFPIRTFCITLPETPERTEKAKAHFRERGVEVEFFDGIHAEKFGLSTVHTYEIDNPGSGFRIGFKPTGIWLSHYMLWAALNLLHDEHFMVLEIDAQFPEDWHSRAVDALKNTPRDFDLLWVGSCCTGYRENKLIAGQVYEVKYPLCTHTYIVAKKALPTILKTQRKVYAPIDISLAFHSMPLLKTYTVLPTITTQFDTVLTP